MSTYILEGASGTDSDCTPAVGFNEQALVTQANSDVLSRTISGPTTDEISFAWTTVSSEPNTTDWPNGDYDSSFNVTNVGGDITYKHEIHRVNSSCATQATLGTSGSQSGTGVKTFTVATDPSSGASTDRYQMRVLGSNAAAHGNQKLDITPTASSFIKGPWNELAPVELLVESIFSTTVVTIEANRHFGYQAELAGRLAWDRLRRM